MKLNNNSLNDFTKRNLNLMDRIYKLHNAFHNELLLLENGVFLRKQSTTKYVPTDVVDSYDPDTDKETIKTIQQKIEEIENWYIVVDTTKSIVLDNRVRNILNKHKFDYGHIINMSDDNLLYIQLVDKQEEKEEEQK